MSPHFRLPPSRDRVRADVDAELEFHLEGRIDELMASGMSRAEAAREARRRFGDADAVRAQVERIDQGARVRRSRREWSLDVARDARLAVRALLRRPAYALAVVATLTLGIGANTAIFSVADALLFRPPPYPNPSELLIVWGRSVGEYTSLQSHTHSYRSLAAYAASQMNVGDDRSVVRTDGAEVSENFFATLGVVPVRGRAFSAGANAPGARAEVVLSDALWRTQFGADTALIGRTILVEGIPRTVTGIMPVGFHFPSLETKLWLQATFDSRDAGGNWGWSKYTLVGRLARGATIAAARTEIRRVAPQIRHENPLWDPGPNYGAGANVTPLQAQLAGPARTTLLVLLGVVFALLLIACANVANLVLVRSVARVREFSVRAALGCTSARMIRQLTTENLVLAGAGGACGVLAAWLGVRALTAALPPQIPHTAAIGVDGRVLAFAAVVTTLSGLVFGLVPAMRAAWPGRGAGLGGARGGSAGVRQSRLTSALTIVQMALAVVLLASAGLLLRSFDALRHVDPGFAAERVLAARVTLSPAAYQSPAKTVAFFDALQQRLAASAGDGSVALINRPPLRGAVYGTALRVEGQFEDVRHTLPDVEHQQVVTPAYFATMGISVLRGRTFTSADHGAAPPVAIISAAVARKFWPNEDPIGKRVGLPYASPWITVIGVVAEVRQDSLNGVSEATIYRPMAQVPDNDMTVVSRTTNDAPSFAATVRRAVAELDPAAPVSDVRAMSEIVTASLARTQFTAALLGGFALLAMALAGVGLYGVVAFGVSQRSREYGVRLALGATPGALLHRVIRGGAVLAMTGTVVGLIAALAVTRTFRGLLYSATTADPLTFIAAPALLLGIAVLATWIPARRAVRTDPLTALRSD